MNIKKTALALAVAAVAGTPIIAAAQGSIYGSARYGLSYADGGNNSEAVADFQDFGSRFGVKGDRDLGNGKTAYGHWETRMFDNGTTNVRDFKVGIRSDSSDIYMGDGINHAWDSFMTSDDTWWYGGSRHLTEGVQSSAITYMGSAGSAKFAATVAAGPETNNADEELTDQIELVAAFDAGGLNIAVGMTDPNTANNDPDPVIGFVVKGAAGDMGYKFDYQSQEDDNSMQVEVSMGNFLAQYGMQDIDANADSSSALTLSYTQPLADGVLMWYEMSNWDDKNAFSEDTLTVFAATLKIEML